MARNIPTSTATSQLTIVTFGVCVVFVVLMTTRSEADEWTDVYSVLGQSVRLECPLPRARPARIDWHDLVYNNDPNPKRIFTSSGGRRTMDETHENRRNYQVDPDFSLVIKNVQLDDVGKYMCTSRINDTTRTKSYYLSVSGNPSCNGTASLNEGESTNFSCSAVYSGLQPMLQWRRQSEPVESEDLYEVRLAEKVLDFEAVAGDDGSTFTCLMTFGTVVRQCHINLTVYYAVRDLFIDPIKDSYSAGEKIQCSANGNPDPDILIRPSLDQGPTTTGVGWRSVTIPKSLRGQSADIECLASNTVGGRKETIAKTVTLTVSGSEQGSNEVIEMETEKPNTAKSASASSSGAIVGGIIVGIMILGLVIAAVFCVRLRKEKKPKKEENGDAKSPVLANKETSQKKERENQGDIQTSRRA